MSALSVGVYVYPVHSEWMDWSEWGGCTVTCGGGQRRRFRTCVDPTPTKIGRPCVGPGQETELCNVRNCAGSLICLPYSFSYLTSGNRYIGHASCSTYLELLVGRAVETYFKKPRFFTFFKNSKKPEKLGF